MKTEDCDSQVLVDGAGQVIAEGMAVSVAKEAVSMTETARDFSQDEARREPQEGRAKIDRAKGRRRR